MNVTAYEVLREKLGDRDYRDAFVSATVRRRIALQVRALRKKFFSSQTELGAAVGKPQNVVSRLEDPSYGKVTLQTLLELAKAFDVALVVKFAKFSELAEQADKLADVDLVVPSFEQELAGSRVADRALEGRFWGDSRRPTYQVRTARSFVAGGELNPSRLGSLAGISRKTSAEQVL